MFFFDILILRFLLFDNPKKLNTIIIIILKKLFDVYFIFLIIMNQHQFNKNLEELLPLFNSQKVRIVEFIKKNFEENKDYAVMKNSTNIKTPRNGKYPNAGKNKIDYFLTEKTFELTKNSFNLKHKYIPNILNNLDTMMSIENRTIGWIENSYKGVLNIYRQYSIGKYRVDLFFPDYKLIIECDENDHIDRDILLELDRQNYLISLGYCIIRYNPNDNNFDGSILMRYIHNFIHNYEISDYPATKIIKVNFLS